MRSSSKSNRHAGTREGNDGALDLDRVVHINRAHVHARSVFAA